MSHILEKVDCYSAHRDTLEVVTTSLKVHFLELSAVRNGVGSGLSRGTATGQNLSVIRGRFAVKD